MAVFTGGALGTLILLACPHCRVKQARARKPGGGTTKYRCRECHRTFTRDDGVKQAKASESRR